MIAALRVELFSSVRGLERIPARIEQPFIAAHAKWPRPSEVGFKLVAEIKDNEKR
jgi:hypothetical protein